MITHEALRPQRLPIVPLRGLRASVQDLPGTVNHIGVAMKEETHEQFQD